MLDALYVKQVNDRKAVEQSDRTIIDDLLQTQKAHRELIAKFQICNKNEALMAKVDELNNIISEKDKELTRCSKIQIDMNQQHKVWKQKVEKADNEFGYVTFSLQETQQVNVKLKKELE